MIVLLILLILRKRIALVVQLFKEAGKAVHAMPLLILQPLVVSHQSIFFTRERWRYFVFQTFLALVITGVMWSIGTLGSESAGTAACGGTSCTGNNTEFVTYQKDSFLMWMR